MKNSISEGNPHQTDTTNIQTYPATQPTDRSRFVVCVSVCVYAYANRLCAVHAMRMNVKHAVRVILCAWVRV